MPDKLGRPYVYLAGPDVFYPDVAERAELLKKTLAEHGIIGMFPADNNIDAAQYPDRKDIGLAIGEANEALMRKADIVIANVQPWRGVEADDGTAYEVGFMSAQDKMVVLYTNDPRPFAERVTEDYYQGKVHLDGPLTRGDSDNMMFETFPGFADNLMLVNAATKSQERLTGEKPDPAAVVQPSFEKAADLAKTLWNQHAKGIKYGFNTAADEEPSEPANKKGLIAQLAKMARASLAGV